MKKFFENFSIMGFVMLMLCVVLGVGDVSGAICADAAPLTPSGTGNAATSDVNNVQTTNNVSAANPNNTGGLTSQEVRAITPDLIEDPVDQNIVKIRPYANPIDTILRYAGAEQINNLVFGWYSIGTRPVWDKTTAAAVMTAAANKKNVYGTVAVSDASLFDVTDTVKVAISGGELQLYIFKKDSTNGLYFTVAEDQMVAGTGDDTGKYTIPAFGGSDSSAATLYIMGRAAAEKDVTSPELSVLPEKKTGYCQIFMMQIEENTYAKMADKEIKFDLSEVEENVMFEYRRRMEGTWLKGIQGKVWDPEKNTYVYNTAGLLSQIKKTHTL